MTDPANIYARLTQAFNQRAWRQAQELAARLLSLAPQHAQVHYIAGVAHMELQDMPKALGHLHQAFELEPRRVDFATQFAKALAVARLLREAREIADKALALMPDDPLTLDTLGVVYAQTHAHAQAVAVFQRTVALNAAHAPYRFNLATSLLAIGDIDAGEDELKAAIQIDPGYWRAHLTLARLRRQTATSNHIDPLQSLLIGQENNPNAQTYLNMALAKEYEDLENYPKAFQHLVRGKAAAGAGRDYSIDQDEALFAAIIAAFPEPRRTTTGFPTNEPIFVIGMPRSGTTLVERILSSHPDVYSAGELMNFGMTLKRASGSRTPLLLDPDTILRARDLDWTQLGEAYLSSTRPATGHTPRFVDKLPHNFQYAGYIARALPKAKIVCLRRDPMDTCLSNFRQLFAPTSSYFDYSLDLLDTGRYYVLFDRLMAHWQRVLPGRILEVDYETLVETQEASSRRILDFCGLSWHEACLHFEENPSPVATASVAQVRSPIYRNALRRWRKYEAQMDPLHALLTEAGIPLTS